MSRLQRHDSILIFYLEMTFYSEFEQTDFLVKVCVSVSVRADLMRLDQFILNLYIKQYNL